MAYQGKPIHAEWSSSFAFILAATGSAVGLGNIWKFPYIAGENGGGAFVLVYLACIAVIGIPVMMAETMLGRRSRQSPINGLASLADQENLSRRWSGLGWLGVAAGFLILSFYSVVAGWAVAYVFKMAAGTFTGMEGPAVDAVFGAMLAQWHVVLGWHTLFMVLCFLVVARGIRSGIEQAVRVLMPLLFLLLLLLVAYAYHLGDFGRGLSFMFTADFSALSGEAMLVALGHAFFTLSLGMGAIMVYGSYLPRRASIAGTTFLIAGADTLVALLSGLAIFPIVFATGLEASAGPGLLFQTLPYVFGQMPAGAFFGTLFFLLVSFAALTSGLSLLEPAVAYLVENRDWSRRKATAVLTFSIWALGLCSVFSLNLLADFYPLGFIEPLEDKTLFDLFDGLSSNIMLPLGGLLIALFAGWRMHQASSRDELAMGRGYRVWRFIVRYVSPVLIALVLAYGLGLFQAIGLL
ncbi:sodium-dependent transporter [Alkalilimnicola sp. S0819]|uniref:sodium-dependent transporter n=1 Tax=Alkalilimnicola sp. S0819 TaxID=2613922 RepID=UPI00128B65DA|nr:sodium-dependent transporter [Alkalilimnicola sp. S0819]